MDKVMLIAAIVVSVLGAIWMAVIVIAGRQLDVHRRRIAELESELEDASQQQRSEHGPDNADYKRGA